jgi:hypothetical protein
MKNLNYFPFERNKYFYGKLLSVDDFETEQKYMNDKRRIINRFLHGSGVVSGMNVVIIDDRTISVEMGLALDFAGREIVIDKPLTKKLSMIEGFESYMEADEDNSNLYLCIDYAENEKEAVHSIAGSHTSGRDNGEYNKYEESYRLFLTNVEPKEENLSYTNLYEEALTVFWGNGIRIKQVMPKIVESGKNLELKIIVENMGQQLPISFSYTLELICLENEGKNWITIEFNEENYEKSYQYEFLYKLQTSPVKEIEGTAIVDNNSFELNIGGRKVAAIAKGKNSTHIINGNVKTEIINRYYKSAMENISQNSYQNSIYLAKISVIKAGSSYLMDHIQNMPFKQFVFNNVFAAAINDIHMNEIKTIKSELEKRRNEIVQYSKDDKNTYTKDLELATGTAILDLGIGGIVGQRFYTEKIAHGLGVGKVNISLGQAYSLRDESNIVFGSPEVFNDKEATFRAELAAKVDVMNGTFTIGIRLTEATTVRQVKVLWMAVKDAKENIYDKTERNIYIKPDMLYLNLRESYYLKAVLKGINDERVKWHVKEEGGGTIDENGMYTAPNKIGVFEVITESVVYPDLRTSAFVAVRNISDKQ